MTNGRRSVAQNVTHISARWSAKVVLALSHPEPRGRPARQLIVDANNKCEAVGLAARALELQTHSLKNRRTRVSDFSAYKAGMAAQEV
ncbi:hypothetical protein VC83_02680 [Pseudogymnoascus destructans]|uniref:Uncharacterized protein n=1 Tax=Pseudogymnoascus destructans TaxID=655981 RepID=A0A177AIT6_9PEZI|nr:uncharacterized protein VC83_02680 [Pseudogymnoascus destructans]OAF61183.1 hypothetical protein VC83_02680 [Pseudogymnoascus destructans]